MGKPPSSLVNEQEFVQRLENCAKMFGAEAAESLKCTSELLGWFLPLASYKQLGLVVSFANKWCRHGLACSKSCHYWKGRRQKHSWWGSSWVVLLPRDCLDWESCSLMAIQRSPADKKKHPEKNLCQGREWDLEIRWKRCWLKEKSCRSKNYRISQTGWFGSISLPPTGLNKPKLYD